MIEITKAYFFVSLLIAFYCGGFVRAFVHTIYAVENNHKWRKMAGSGFVYWAVLLWAATTEGIAWPFYIGRTKK